MKIGRNLKTLRKQHNLTIQELADRCDLSKGFISQIEHDLASPSIETLEIILDVYGINFATFFADNNYHEKFVFNSEDIIIREENEYQINWLVPNAHKLSLEPILLTLKPFGSSKIIQPFQGVIFGYVLSGKIILHYGKKTAKVKAKESFFLKGKYQHYLENGTNKTSEIIWVSNPPNF